jgi:hypothetical protein
VQQPFDRVEIETDGVVRDFVLAVLACKDGHVWPSLRRVRAAARTRGRRC